MLRNGEDVTDVGTAGRRVSRAPIEAWPRSEQLWERTKRSLPGGVSTGLRAAMPPHPLFFERGDGPRLLDVDGHSYLDYVLGWGPVILFPANF